MVSRIFVRSSQEMNGTFQRHHIQANFNQDRNSSCPSTSRDGMKKRSRRYAKHLEDSLVQEEFSPLSLGLLSGSLSFRHKIGHHAMADSDCRWIPRPGAYGLWHIAGGKIGVFDRVSAIHYSARSRAHRSSHAHIHRYRQVLDREGSADRRTPHQ